MLPGSTAGAAPAGGGNGGAGRTSVGSGTAGSFPGGGGGGAVRGSSGSPSGGSGGHGQVIISYTFSVDAGSDQSQCRNAIFNVSCPTPPPGYTATWSVISGTGFIYDNSKINSLVNVPAGSSATVRLTVTNGTITVTDDVILTNTTACTGDCISPLNANGNLENSGTITNYNLSFQSTPAALIYQSTNPINWSEAYGSSTPNTTSFTGAYLINKTGANGHPRSGSKMVYMAGAGFCLSALKTGAQLQCGKTYRVSVWIAAFTNSTPQSNSSFVLEFFGGGNNMPGFNISHHCIAQASTSWNNLNWQRYSFDFTIPSNGYEWGDFVFTTLDNTKGIVIDDMCVEEIFSGATANAGPDIFSCSNQFTMAANSPSSGYTGNWSVVSGTATVANASLPTTSVTLTSGSSAQLRWTVSSASGTNRITALNPEGEGGFENCCDAYDNGWNAANHTTNTWQVGTVSNPSSGNRAAFISNNGGTSYAYTLTSAQTSHLYKDVVIHPNANNINLSFKWKGFGQSGNDRLLVYTAPTNVTPVAGSPASTSTTLSGATLVSTLNLHSSYNYQTATIVLPNSLAGTTVRLIFTWQNNASSGTTPPASIDEVSLVYDMPACSQSDVINLAYSSSNNLSVNNSSICPGSSTTLSATGCSAGSLLWSTGATTSSITVSPASTTSYSVTCTPAASSNVLLNPGFESTTNLQNWSNWDNGSITTNSSHIYSGGKAAVINTMSAGWGGIAQDISVTPGQRYRISFYGKSTNINGLPTVRYQIQNSSWNVIEDNPGIRVTSTNYQRYELELVIPPDGAYLTLIAEVSEKSEFYVDQFEVLRYTACQSTAMGTVTVISGQSITLSNLNVGSCINHPLQDVVPVSVNVAWTSAPSNDYLGVTINNKTEYINVGGGATSPQTVTFYVPANGVTNISVFASWYFNPTFGCSNTLTFNAPNPCSSDILNCDILYLCGLDKPSDGDAFDHGFIEYIMANNSGNLVPALVKDNGTSNDFYDPMDQNTPLPINVNDYDLIIASPTTQGYISSRLNDILLSFKGSILNMNYLLQQGIGMSNGAGYYDWGNTAYTSASNAISIYNYDNINPNYSLVKTGATTKAGVDDYLWFNAGDANGTTNAMGYKYTAHSISGVSTTHGHRQYLGLHMNGLYSNAQNGGYIPAPASSYFHPAKHLSQEMKIILDQTLKDVAKCTPEICTNQTDDDGDGLTDCNDPDCWKLNNREFDNGSTNWDFYAQGGAAATQTVDNTSQLSGKNAARINITTSTGTNWHVQFLQNNVLLESGKTYRFSFRAKAASNRTITAIADLGASPWTSFFSQDVNLTTSSQTFTYTFSQATTTSIGRVGFNVGQSSQTVWIDNVAFYEVCTIPEICDNTIDDDGDGQIDCSDPDCPCCNNLTSGGIISGNEIQCQNYNPGIITSVSPATSPSGTIVYQWEYSNNSTTWFEIAGATTLTYDPGFIYQTTYYRRKAKLQTCNTWSLTSNVISKQNTGFDNFQVLTLNNMTFNGSTHVHGPLAVGGNLIINTGGTVAEVNNDNTGTYIFPGDGSISTGIMVRGGITFTSGSIRLLSNRYMHIGNSTNLESGDNGTNSATRVYPAGTNYNHSLRIEGTIDQTPSPAVFQNVAYDFDALFTQYRSSSINLGSRTNNVQLLNSSNAAISGNNVTTPQTVKINSLSTGYNYLNLTTASLNNITGITFETNGFPGSTKVLIINVPITANFTWNNPNFAGLTASTSAPYMIWNFYGSAAYTLTINNSALIFGTIFAPNQNILKVGQNDIEGSVIANSCTLGNGQLHDFMFANFCNILDCVESIAVSITGPTEICSGTTGTLTASTGQTYLWNTGATTASINVTSSATYTVTVTSNLGCTGTASKIVNVLTNPTAPAVGTITQPGCIVNTGSVILNSLPSSGTWTLTRTPGGNTYTGTGTSYTVTGLPANTTYTFTVTNSNNCVSGSSANIVINPAIVLPVIGGANSSCTGVPSNVTPSSGGTWASSNIAVASVTNAGVVTSIAAGSVTLTYTRTSDGCSNSTPFTVNANPSAPLAGTITQPTCTTQTGSVVLSGLPASGSWTLTRTPGGTTYTGSGTSYTVSGLPVSSSYTFTVTNANNCVSVASANVTINGVPANPALGGAIAVCVGLTANVTPNTSGTWASSNNAIATITNAGVVTGVAVGSVTLTYTRTADGCSNSTPFTVNSNPSAPVVGTITQPTCTTPTGSVALSGLTASGSWTITRTPGGTTYTGSGTSYTVTGLPVSSSYTFTVTNANNCVSVASAGVTINSVPTNPITGGTTTVCVGSTANVTPSINGSWASSNNTIATITNAGVVTGVAAGSVTLTYTRTADGCSNTLPFTVNANPSAPIVGTITQPTCITTSGSVALSGLPASGSWIITRIPGGTTYSGSGTTYTVTGLPVNTTYTFTVTNSNLCTSPSSANVVINPIPTNPVIGGATSVCVGATASVTPNTLGTWASSNIAIATITNAGVVTGIAVGSVTLTYTRTADGCANSIPFNVQSNPSTPVLGSITQPTCVITTGSVFLNGLPSTGSWTITRTPGGTTYSGSGTSYTVTGLPANATYTFTVTNSNSCTSPSSANVTINPIPTNPVIGGATSICVGSTTNITPSTLGTWATSNAAIATITNAGAISGISAGSVTFTYTRTADGCANSIPFTVYANPSAPVTGTITQPTCIITTGSVALSGLPASGSWTITRTPGGTTYSGSGTTYSVTGLPANATYTFTVTNSNSCSSPSSANVVVNAIPTNPVTGGASSVCVGLTANVTPNTSGTWASSNNAIATVTNAGVVTGVAAGSITLTYTRTADGCSNTLPFTVNANPSAPVIGTITQPTCIITTGSVALSGLPASGSWTITRTPGGTTYSGSGTTYSVTGLPVNATYTFAVTNSNTCTSPSSANVVVNPIPTNPVTGGAASVCVGLTANVTPNTSGTWASSNNAIATVTNAGVVTGVAAGSVTLTYTRTADGCSNTLPFTVNANPSAPVIGTITQPTCITTTGSVALSGLPASGSWTITRTPGGTTYSGSGTTYTVTGLPENATYTFTVTNSNSCTSPSSANVVVNPIPTNPVTGGENSVCVGETADVTPNTSGTWASSNNAIATVTNAGVVTGVAAGSVTLTYTRTADGCSNTLPFTVNANPSAPVIGTITQPTCATPTGTVILSDLPSSGSWTITRTPGSNTYTGSGTSFTVTSLPADATYTFAVANSNSCTSPSSANVVVSPIPGAPVLGGGVSVCIGGTANVTPSTDGTWASSNSSIATVTNAGVVNAIAAGAVTLTYTRTADGCSNTLPFTVNANPSAPVIGTITQPTCITTTGSVALSGLPSSGSWTITRTPGGTTYSGSGTTYSVTGLPANATYTFTVTNSNSCSSLSSANVVINAIPTNPVTGGASSVCVGETADVTPNTSGMWASSNNAIATVTNAGVVTGVAAGSVTLTYTRTADGCSNTLPFTVNANPSAPVIGTITQPTCITTTGSVALSGLPASGSWTITRTPGGTTYSGSGTTYSVTDLPENATYTFTVTNSNLCSSPSSANVVVNPIPTNPVTGGAASVCVGETADVTPNTSGTWASSNNAIATITNAGVVTGVAAGSVTLTYTRTADGCSNTLPFTVNANPSAPVIGTITQPTCITTTGSVALSGLPASGSWTITRTPGGTTYSGSGTTYSVTGLPENATYTFTVTNSNSCTSPSSANVVVNPIPTNPVTGGENSVCVGETADVTPNTSGTWASSNNAIATVTNAGVVTGVAAGSVTLTYTRTADGCSNTLPFTVNANPSAPLLVDITQPTCITTTGNVDLSGLPSSGSWTITGTPGGTTYSGSGNSYTVTGLPANATYTFTVTNTNNCTSPASTDVEINPIPTNPVTGGENAVCVGSTANVTPGTSGTWVSSNITIATISNDGVVSGIAAGSVTLTYTRTADGCSNTLPFIVNANPSAPLVGNIIQPTCITTTGSVDISGLPASGSWTITRTPGETTYTDSGSSYTIAGLTANTTYSFTLTNSDLCTSSSSANVVINPIPTNPVTDGTTSVCVGLTANVTPNTAGIWTSSNTAIANITNDGVVTGIAAGAVILTYTRTSDGCSNTLPFTVNANPSAPLTGTVTQPTCTTPTGSLELSALPATGLWTITVNPGGNTYSGSGTSYTINGLPVSTTYSFNVTNSNNCISPASTDVTINAVPSNPTLGGATSVCIGSDANVTPSNDGSWSSSNDALATITNTGVVTGVAAGTVTLTYIRSSDGCSNDIPFTVYSNPSDPVTGTITHPTCIVTTGSVVLNNLPSTGNWIITQMPGGNTYSGSGTTFTVTSLPVNDTYTFMVTNQYNCSSGFSAGVHINNIPSDPVVGGTSDICVGLTTFVTPESDGIWSSSNLSIATITNAGLVTGLSSGSVILTYTRNADGCDSAIPLTVNANPTPPVSETVTQPTCYITTGSVQLSGLPSSGTWIITRIPGSVTYTGSGTSYTVNNLPPDGNYVFYLTDNNTCVSPNSANVIINAIPGNPTVGGSYSVCAGQSANVTPSVNGTWISSNSNIAEITNSGVVTGISAGVVTLTYTRTSDGCSNSLPFTVFQLPETPIIGITTQPTCIVQSGSVDINELPSSGSWTLTRIPGGITYNGTGNSFTVTNLPPSTNFTFTITNTNLCVSNPSDTVDINGIPEDPVIEGDNFVCVGSTGQVTPETNGVWNSSNNGIATVNNAGEVTGISAGTAILTYTRYSDGCFNTKPISVYDNPIPPVVGQIIQPTCTTPTGSVTLHNLPSIGNWIITILPGGNTITGTGSSYIVTGLPPNQSYTFNVTNNQTCTSSNSAEAVINPIPADPVPGGPSTLCVGSTIQVTPGTSGTWASNNELIATVNNAGAVTGIAAGNAVLTYTRTSDGCFNTKIVTVYDNPIAPVTGSITQPNCQTTTGSVLLTGLPAAGLWTITRTPGGILYTGSGSSYTVTGLPAGNTYTFTVTNSNSCTSVASDAVIILPVPANPSVSIDYFGSVCFTENKNLSALVSGGLIPYQFNWTGPSGYSSDQQAITIVQNGNYYVTVTDANYCTAITSGFVYEEYVPFIVSVNTTVCEGQNVTLDINSATAVSYLWSTNAGSATTKMVTVSPTVPSSTYLVTITNDLGCTAVPNITISVNPRPVIEVSGPDELCIGETSSLIPSTGGNWTSTNPSVAIVNNTGMVTAISAGSATFLYTENVNNCTSLPSIPILVHPKPITEIYGPDEICIGDTTYITPATGGTWTSSAPSVASINNEGLIQALSAGSATFVFTDTITTCFSESSSPVEVSELPIVTITGPGEVCVYSNITLSTNFPGGVWSSSNPDIATVSNNGIVTALETGTVTIYYDFISGPCIGQVAREIIINEIPVAQWAGDQEICVGQTSNLTPSEGGTWTSSNPLVATVTSGGLVTALLNGYATFVFQNSTTGCISEPSTSLTVFAKPTISLSGPSGICIGATTNLLPFSGGTWNTSNELIATVTNGGLVTGISTGSAVFTFTHSETGCTSEASLPVQVGSAPTATIDFHGNVCLTDTSKITAVATNGNPGYTYQWVGPLGFSANTAQVNITNNGLYYVTITDSYGCKSNASGYVYQRFDPFIVNLSTQVCEGQSIPLSVNASSPASYLWSVNAGSATGSAVNVSPMLPSTTYYVTVTNTLGCKAVAQAVINVNPKPSVLISGPNAVCLNQSTQMSPSSGGTWVSLSPSVAAINNSGLITGVGVGTARFLYTNTSSGCTSDTSGTIQVYGLTPTSLAGPSTICVGAQTNLLPNTGGTWTALHPARATINNSGLVTAISQGNAQFRFTNSQGCVSSSIITVIVYDKPTITLDGPNPICVGTTTQMLPSTGGTWTSSANSIASVSGSGLVTGLSPGNIRLVFTNTFTGCKSDSSALITVLAGTTASVTGPTSLCVGNTTSLSPTTGGSWVSNHPTIASVNNSGIVTALNPGTATFTFTSFATGCPSAPTAAINVNARPVVSITGPAGICIGSTTTVTPASGGSWISSNPAIATITNGGIVTGISPGIANFTFTNSSTGCVSLATANITVNPKPTITLNQSSICIGATTTLQPSSGGTWSSSNPSVASIQNNGFVNGISPGTVSFRYTQISTGCISDPSPILTVLPKPTTSITGPTEICQGQTSQLSPTSGGTWTSLQPSVASVTNSGLVTGLLNGTSQFVFTSASGCNSDPLGHIIINGKPVLNLNGPASICEGTTTQLQPSSGGIWVSSKPSVATITSSGLVTGISQGTARFIFTNTQTGCVSDSSSLITVAQPPVISLTGPESICIGQNTQMTPTAGGTWVALTPNIATVSNTGLVTGLEEGEAYFRFIQAVTGCETVSINPVTILNRPEITFRGATSICLGGNTQLNPSSGGTWTALNPGIATIDNAGNVTGISQGLARFVFTENASGCSSLASGFVTVINKPNLSLNGSQQICIGTTTQFLPNSGGVWTSGNTNIATISDNGLVTGTGPGTVSFIFTDNQTGCSSDASLPVTVMPAATLTMSGPSEICLGATTTLSSSSTGIWYSSRAHIAKTTSNGLVTGNAPGKVTFYFTEASSGCTTYLPDNALTVVSCIDPDFNVTMSNVAVNGNVKTNDEVPAGTSYVSSVALLSKPVGSTPNITMNNNGNYVFQADKPGIYRYNVTVCLPSMINNCPVSLLVITVVSPDSEKQNIVPNVDAVFTYEGQYILINTLENDKCMAGIPCSINPGQVSLTDLPNNGNASVQINGHILYTPTAGFAGLDTIQYKICASDDPLHCLSTSVIITVIANNAKNTLSTTDDFFFISKGLNLENAGLLQNDFDPETGVFNINQVGNITNPITIPQGEYYITTGGQLFFTPNVTFSGPVDIVYTICDEYNFCVNATAHILVLDNMRLRIRAYLEGAIMENGEVKSSDNRPLMRDNLRINSFTGQNYLPVVDPYTIPGQFFDLTHSYEHFGGGDLPQFLTIQNPETVFAVSGQDAIVDWVFVEIRSKNDYTTLLGTRSALIQRDGDVVDLDGVSYVEFPGIRLDSCYIVLRHRTHLGVMSELVSTKNLLDFTSPATPVFDFGTSKNDGYDYTGLAQKNDVYPGYMVMWAGDFDGNGRIKFVNPNDDQNYIFYDVFSYPTNSEYIANYNFTYGYLQGDYNLNGKTKYDNPDDDKNMLFYQVLFYPLNVNYMANFDFIIEQIPPVSNR
jgi:uncharacterized protein YjdB